MNITILFSVCEVPKNDCQGPQCGGLYLLYIPNHKKESLEVNKKIFSEQKRKEETGQTPSTIMVTTSSQALSYD